MPHKLLLHFFLSATPPLLCRVQTSEPLYLFTLYLHDITFPRQKSIITLLFGCSVKGALHYIENSAVCVCVEGSVVMALWALKSF